MTSLHGHIIKVAVACASMVAMGLGQVGSAPTQRPSSELLLENDYFRVFRVAVQSGEVPIRDEQSRDVVVIALSPAASDSEAQVTFVPRSAPPQFVPAEIPYDALIVELKKHWEPVVRPCASPMTCVHKITVAGLEVGETTALFSNGFVTAYRHHLVPGGTLDSSYHSSKGTNRILLVALTDLPVNVGGIEESLQAGQVYFSDQTEVEVNAGSHEATWVVVRILAQK